MATRTMSTIGDGDTGGEGYVAAAAEGEQIEERSATSQGAGDGGSVEVGDDRVRIDIHDDSCELVVVGGDPCLLHGDLDLWDAG